ncbi:MAG TPA: hypothetical protein VFQ12_02435 [Thermoleophilaceae bacterium]|nr:hypothetical protein [Thermoleophilaceae bacterium]
MTAFRRLVLLLVAAGVAGHWLRKRLETPAPELPPALPGPLEVEEAPEAPAAAAPLEMGPVTDEMNAIPLPLEEELAMVDAAEPEPAPQAEPAADELARAETAESEVTRVPLADEPDQPDEPDPEPLDIVAVVDDLLEQPGDS